MQIVIDIPEEMWEWLHIGFLDEDNGKHAINAILKGTPLPKGHGRLIDEKEIDTVVNGIFSDCNCSPKFFLNVIHNQCIEVVETDKTESEVQG